jgi:hypothetical protein
MFLDCEHFVPRIPYADIPYFVNCADEKEVPSLFYVHAADVDSIIQPNAR